MLKHYRTFYTVFLLILLSTAIVMFLYTYTINTSLKTVREDIQANNLNRIRQIATNINYNVEQLSMLAIALEVNPKIKMLASIDILDKFDQIKLRLELEDLLHHQRFSQAWNNQISVYSHSINTWIGSLDSQPPPSMNQISMYPDYINTWIRPSDSLPPPSKNKETFAWTYDVSNQRFTAYRAGEYHTIRVTFPQSNLQDIIDNAKLENNDPLFFHLKYPEIKNSSADDKVLHELLPTISPILNNRVEGTEIISIDKVDYMVNFIQLKALDWYLIDYLPLDEVFDPINQTRRIFYVASLLLFIGSLITLIYLYRKVQIPIITMLKGVRQIKEADYAFRIKRRSDNEFDILYENFNDMANEIENLVEKVYKEKLISREAMIKKLQAQINPHFLYNCLFFINNMNRLGNDEAVEAMTQNLAEYFRYSTRLDESVTTLEKELGVVNNYLTIQHLRMQRLTFDIQIPEHMTRLLVPKLLLQPLVENSVVHGIESKQGESLIRVIGIEMSDQYHIIVEDNGRGMTTEEILLVMERIQQPLDDSIGCALWNIRQRMLIHFQKPAGITITHSKLGGLSVTLFWPKNQLEGREAYVSTNDSRR